MSKKLLFLFQFSIIAEHTDKSSTFTDNEPSYLTLECSIMYSFNYILLFWKRSTFEKQVSMLNDYTQSCQWPEPIPVSGTHDTYGY